MAQLINALTSLVCRVQVAIRQHLHEVLIRLGHGHRIVHGDGDGVRGAALVRTFQPFDDLVRISPRECGEKVSA